MKDFTSSILESKGWEMFRAGWRPTVGWVCGLALLYNFIARDIIVILYDSVPAIHVIFDTREDFV